MSLSREPGEGIGEMPMALKNWLSGWKDPVRRPRYIIWTGAVVIFLALFIVTAFVGTSTYFFCDELCHSIQDDAMNAYRAGSHNMVNCLSCHEPVNADPITFAYYKARAGIIGAYQLYTGTNETPLNAHSKLALNEHHMGSEQCTQCHSENREVTPSNGIIINHEVHEENEIHCTVCHNRVAHPEKDLEMVNKSPRTGEISPKHVDWMNMIACFRCHTLTDEVPEAGIKAPGTCSTCHPADFELKPENHKEDGFYPKGHAELAMAEVDPATGRPDPDYEAVHDYPEWWLEENDPEYHGPIKGEHIFQISPVENVDYCSTCHVKETFCDGCHGVEMPHPEEFKTTSHGEIAKAQGEKCDLCHGVDKAAASSCDSCHHGEKSNWTYDAAVPWEKQHANAVTTNGVAGCLGACHDQQYCTDCHAKVKPIPSSHKEATWLRDKLTVTAYGSAAAQASGKHALAATAAIDSCEICHGPGGTGSEFCKKCHGMEMPHPDAFKKDHVSAKKTPQLCANCHTQKELCSDCHHKGAKNGTPWQQVHPAIVKDSGAQQCYECHEETECSYCHVRL